MVDNQYLYQVFCAVAEAKNYDEASEKLHITKSTISAHIKKLEDILGITLFYREREGLLLTDAGRELFEDLVPSIKQIEFAERKAIQNNDIQNARLTIGCPTHLYSFYLSKCIEKIKNDYPNIKVDLIGVADYQGLINKLKEHTIDFVVIDVLPNDLTKEMKVKEMKKIHNTFISNKPLQLNDIKELENQSLILNYENSTSSKELYATLKQHDVDIKAEIHADATEMRIEEVKMGHGIGYVMKEAVEDDIKNEEIYEVILPISLPEMKINLVYIEKYLTKIDKIFIKEYMK